jgi:hypothetical protein
MIEITVKATGIDKMGRRMTKRHLKAKKVDWVIGKFQQYMLRQRLPNMWRNQGVVKGRYGKGSKKWADNTDWVRRAKGFNKPLFARKGSSAIRKSYHFSKRVIEKTPTHNLIRFKLENKHEAVKYLEAGYKQFAVTAGGWTKKGGKKSLYFRWSPRVKIHRLYAFPGPMKARWIQGFIRGDAKWLAQFAAKEGLKVE